MKYQLVLQWHCDADMADLHRLVEIEDTLLVRLPTGSGEVDGHDIGSKEMNIFILTNEPLRCFERVKAILGKEDAWANIRVAYRELAGENYAILWPPDLTEFAVA
jgi:hypothetical protein